MLVTPKPHCHKTQEAEKEERKCVIYTGIENIGDLILSEGRKEEKSEMAADGVSTPQNKCHWQDLLSSFIIQHRERPSLLGRQCAFVCILPIGRKSRT